VTGDHRRPRRERHSRTVIEPEDPDDGASRVKRLLEGGADLAGAVGGVGATALGGSWAGAVVGVAITHTVAAVGRLLSRREEERVGVALLTIRADTRDREERGERPRDDGFFNDRGQMRPEAEDLLEGILRQAAASHEERKVPLLAHLFSSVAHDDSVDGTDAMYLVRLASDLTYQQFVILSAFATGVAAQRPVIYEPELDDLGERLLLGLPAQNGAVIPIGRMHAEMSWNTIKGVPPSASSSLPADLVLSPVAVDLVRLSRANETIPQSERDAWIHDG
jgi:hypothetical protein